MCCKYSCNSFLECLLDFLESLFRILCSICCLHFLAGVFLNVQVKAVYMKNLPKNITRDQLRSLFEHHGKITKVILPPAKPGHENSRFGFVHFAERSNAMKALKNTEKYEIDGIFFFWNLMYVITFLIENHLSS